MICMENKTVSVGFVLVSEYYRVHVNLLPNRSTLKPFTERLVEGEIGIRIN